MDELSTQDDLLEYYRRELAYLRVQGADFARRHPKVARRLALTGSESLDPHTERLIEAFAFLGARIHRDLDAEFPRVASGLLECICPNLAQGVPSMTVAQMALLPSQGRVTAGFMVRRGTPLQAQAAGVVCRFRTVWDSVLWPLRIVQARLHDPRTLDLVFEAEEGYDLRELEIDSLRLHLAGEALTAMPLHELILGDLGSLHLMGGGLAPRPLGVQALQEVGFAEEEEALLRPPHAHPAYGLLQEYFAFPRKFQFFDIRGLRGRLGSGRRFELRLGFTRSSRVLAGVRADTFKLGCVPVVNLFPKTSEPVILDRRRDEYLLVADRRNEDSTEIHSVGAVIASEPGDQRPERIPHAYAHDEAGAASAPLCWLAHRVPTLRANLTGTDTWLGFVDRTDVRRVPSQPVVFAEVWCTNRRLAEQVPPGARLLAQGLPAALPIHTLYEPSAARDPVTGAGALWHLVTLLRLNHASIIQGPQALEQLRQMLMLFAGDRAREQAQIRGITGMSAAHGLAAIRQGTWQGHGRGLDVSMNFDEDAFAGGSPLLLGSVLARFLALYTTTNSFVRLRALSGHELRRQWPAMSGRQCLI